MKWNAVKLGDICIDGGIQTGPFGSQLHQSDYSDEGTPVVMPVDLIDGGISTERIARVNDDHVQRLSRHMLEPGDVVYARRGDVGRCSRVTQSEAGWLCGTGCLRLRADSNLVDKTFLYYALSNPVVVGWVRNHAIGATMPNLNTTILGDVPLCIPDSLGAQRSIASILMAYDNLIENNRRQISLLEETAQRLYREWFVDLRFPEHENTEVVNGTPTGWTKCELGDVVHQSGNAEKKSNRDNYSHYLPIDSIPPKSITCWDSDAIENASSSLVAFKRDDFVFGAMRPYFHKVIIAPYAGLTRTTCFVLNVKDPDYWAYAFAVLTFGDCVRYATSISVGTTMPYVRWEDLRHMPIVVPTKEMATTFKSHFDNIRMRVEVLYKQLAEAREARDRLLPKLMSGEVGV